MQADVEDMHGIMTVALAQQFGRGRGNISVCCPTTATAANYPSKEAIRRREEWAPRGSNPEPTD
ncbi:hypothetical protein G1H10_22685 [Phytoactinopolyspora halotolerans]|uniref:Uncharacterized protein n=1 Tax=Phytoactinopolyspora halotolerans TaxID=1981512 RepID=A0A6L9SEB8_9ACTN|nr:hypothetical protein [Phytoactinopolyspora halotolerans]